MIGAAVLANMWKGGLRVASVTVEGNSIVSENDILGLAGVNIESILFDIDLFAVRKRIEQNPFIRTASVNREVPNRIAIEVEERVPIAAVVLDKIFYFDADGYVLPPTRSENIFDLPVLTGSLQRSELVPGRRYTTTNVQDALTILRMAQQVGDQLYRRISEVHVEADKDIVLHTAEFGVPVIFGRGDTAAKLVKFDTFWNEFVLHHGAHELRVVDLRYRDQVVVRWVHDKEELQSVQSTSTKELLGKKSTRQTGLIFPVFAQ
jgi:cell division protein FtsQ